MAMSSSLEEKWSSQWRSILDDPNSTKSMRDLAISQLKDPIGIGKVGMFTSAAEITALNNRDGGSTDWDIVEAYERGDDDCRAQCDANAIIAFAAETILSREDDSEPPFPVQCVQKRNGKNDVLAAYPEITTASTKIIHDGNKADSRLKSYAYVVLSFLQAQSIEGIGGEAMDNLKRAVRLAPEDWRLHSLLGTRNMAIQNQALCLESLSRAMQLTSDDLAKFSLGIRKGKILSSLSRQEETIATLDEVITLYEDGLKDHPRMSDRLLGQLTVAEYILVQCYGMQGERKKAVNHFRGAEAKRNSISIDVAQTLDWSNRMLAEMMISQMSPGSTAHGECDHCAKVTSSPKRCAACKAVFYCSKDCQVTAWKEGHKKQCKKLKSERRDKNAADKDHSEMQQNRANLPPLDIDLDPKSLWKEGVELSTSGFHEDAAWKFLLALFMDFSLDANDKKPIEDAVNGCESDDPVAMALSVITSGSKKMQRATEVFEHARTIDPSKVVEMGESVEDVNRKDFGLGMCHLIYARLMCRAFAVQSGADARNKNTRDAFEDASKVVMESKLYIDPQRWATQQFELGYSSMDVGAVNEAEKWLNMCIATLDKNTQSSKGAATHWSEMRQRVESRVQLLPLMKMMGQRNQGFLL